MSAKNRVIVSVTNDLYTDQRVHKMCTFIQSQGYEVLLVGRLLKDSKPLDRTYATKRFKLWFTKGAFFYADYNIRLFWFLLFQKAEILVSNDLDSLFANTLIHQLKGTKLVYDSHEYFTEVPELIHRPKVQRIWEKIEGYCFPKLNNIITVNHSIASKYNKKYNKNLRVVRNVSSLFQFENVSSKSALGIPEGKPILILQGAGINVDRGAEELIEAMALLPNAVLLIVGSGDVLDQLKARVQALNISERVLFFGRRPYQEMMEFTYHADLGFTLDKPTNENYLFSLPNKVFDYIHAQTPIIASNLPEVSAIVNKYNVGVVLENHEPKTIANAVANLLNDSDQLKAFKENCLAAKKIENWEKEVEVVADFYPKIN